MPYSWAARDAALELRDAPRRRRTASARTRRSPCASRSGRRPPSAPDSTSGLDDDALDAAVEPRARGRSRDRLRALRAAASDASLIARGGARALREASSTAARASARARARTSSAAATRRSSRSSRTPQNAFRVLAADFVEHRRGHRHRAPGAGLRRGRPRRSARRAGIPVVCPSTTPAASPHEVPTWAGQHVFDANRRDHPRAEGRAARSCATRRSSTTTRTAGAPTRR